MTVAIALFTFTAMGVGVAAVHLDVAADTNVSAELEAPVWSSSKKGVVEFYKKSGVLYRLDLYNVGEEQFATDTTYPDKTGGMYSDEFIPYHIEERGSGNYRCRLQVIGANIHKSKYAHRTAFYFKNAE